jgi:MoaA/NifB/PqqE/SkfB family radical SAM enzyme
MYVSLNPTYYCNFRCSFCYLGEKLSDTKKIDLKKLDLKLKEIIDNTGHIECIDLYGGEILTLPKTYIEDMVGTIRKYNSSPIRVTTNLSNNYEILLSDDFEVTVSYDYKARERHEEVYYNMLSFPKEIKILMLASKYLIKYNPVEIINKLNTLSNLVSVEIKPYSSNQYNQHPVTFKDFEEFVKKFIESESKLKCDFLNEDLIKYSLSKHKNSFSNDHIYITPSGNFAVLEFDNKDDEYFLELDSWKDYEKWTHTEKIRVSLNSFCSSCEYYGSCLSEHLREVKNISNSCNGFKNLLDWYKEKNKL